MTAEMSSKETLASKSNAAIQNCHGTPAALHAYEPVLAEGVGTRATSGAFPWV